LPRSRFASTCGILAGALRVNDDRTARTIHGRMGAGSAHVVSYEWLIGQINHLGDVTPDFHAGNGDRAKLQAIFRYPVQ
jgi:hypothetical protein